MQQIIQKWVWSLWFDFGLLLAIAVLFIVGEFWCLAMGVSVLQPVYGVLIITLTRTYFCWRRGGLW